ncbi:MAG: alanine racemase [Gemmatimonadaceae bacterium]|nr:alanine racemase [Gemmatimonadaceae bacterium]
MTDLPPDARAASARLTVDLGAVRENYRVLARRASVPLLPMVKADAYGLGAVAVVRALEPEGPLAWGVASVDEGCALRAAGTTRPIVVFSPTLPATFAAARAADLELVLEAPAAVAAWTALGGRWHLPIETGMARCGVAWNDATGLAALLAAGGTPASVFTHFHSADLDDDSMATQSTRFERCLAGFATRPSLVHAENSAALLRGTASRWHAARPGIALYGVRVGARAQWTPTPVVTLAAPVIALRELPAGESVSYLATWRADAPRRIATVACGYADGLPRAAGNRLVARLAGRPAPVVGTVTMDMTMLDVTDIPCALGDEATLVGGDATAVGDLATEVQRSPYELLTALRLRAVRRYTAAPALEVAA